MESMSTGSTKVAEKGHTLLIGWNEASVRVVCQLAFLRHTLLVLDNLYLDMFLN
jgi:hypothetical protein